MDTVYVVEVTVFPYSVCNIDIRNCVFLTMLPDGIIPVRDCFPFGRTFKGRICSRDNRIYIDNSIRQNFLKICNNLILFCDIIIYIVPKADADIIKAVTEDNAGRIQIDQLVFIFFDIPPLGS